jgi:zinc transporter ZupT
MTRSWGLALAPLALLAVLVGALVALDPLAPLRVGVPPVEDLTIERAVLTSEPREIRLTVVNGGPEPVTVAQVLVDEAFWPHEIDPGRVIESLRSAVVRIPYPWVEGERHELAIVTSTGLTFRHTIEVAVATPALEGPTLGRLALLGAAVGLLPVAIGLAWYPFVRRLRATVVDALLAFSGGVLLFLAADASVEAIDVASGVPTAFDGRAVFGTLVVVAFAALVAVGGVLRRRGGSGGGSGGGSTAGGAPSATSVAAFIALGIGLHNLGEGLAIGSAYALGEVALTSVLLVGFAIHNSTEGLAIVAPLSVERARVSTLAWLGLLAGGPTIAGAWLGALAFSPTVAVAFLGLGVGAIAQVLWELARLVGRRGGLGRPGVVIGLATGVVVMYLTALLVAA